MFLFFIQQNNDGRVPVSSSPLEEPLKHKPRACQGTSASAISIARSSVLDGMATSYLRPA